jgi:hypothetical protein
MEASEKGGRGQRTRTVPQLQEILTGKPIYIYIYICGLLVLCFSKHLQQPMKFSNTLAPSRIGLAFPLTMEGVLTEAMSPSGLMPNRGKTEAMDRDKREVWPRLGNDTKVTLRTQVLAPAFKVI